MQNLVSDRNMELLTYAVLVAYIAFHPEIPTQLKPFVSHPIAKFAVAASIIYFSKLNPTLAILLALVFITTYLSCISPKEKFADCTMHEVYYVNPAGNGESRNLVYGCNA